MKNKTTKKCLNELMTTKSLYPLPYQSELTSPLKAGQMLIVKGKTAEDSVRFIIDFYHSTADCVYYVPLRISVHFDEGMIVFNSFSKGEWGREERKSNPYKKGDDIDLRIRANDVWHDPARDNKFNIFAYHKEIKEYEYRVPLSHATHLSIYGDILVTDIQCVGSGGHYTLPYESVFPASCEDLTDGKTLLIYGTPKGKRFVINLLRKNGDIALFFNPRFDEEKIIRNARIANEWGKEEREGNMPLEIGIGFDLKIINEIYAFQVFLNDKRFCTFEHRVEPRDLIKLQIDGDVEIIGIQIF